jgi:integrative and conjugative element protein (TIGR02256 family)
MPSLQSIVVISPTHLKEMHAEGMRTFPLETGGILMGFEADECLYVTAVIGPGPKAVHRRRSFLPDAEWQTERVAEVYANSGRTAGYLGDWHTHPRGSTRASFTDILAARSIARYAPARCPSPVMVILAVEDADSHHVAAYRWWRGLLRNVALDTGP